MKSKAIVALNIESLQRARVARGMLQKDVAREAGIGLSTCWRAFSTGLVGVKAARAICAVLGLNLADQWVDVPSRPRRASA